jgi:hypothetical protein
MPSPRSSVAWNCPATTAPPSLAIAISITWTSPPLLPSRRPHADSPGWQGAEPQAAAQLLAWQSSPAGHGLSQAPQLVPSLVVSTQLSPQVVKPSRHAHAAPTQSAPGGHGVSQAPQ